MVTGDSFGSLRGDNSLEKVQIPRGRAGHRGRFRSIRSMAEIQMRVLIADDYYAFRQGLKVMLGFEPDIKVVGEALNGLQTVELVQKHRPDALVMDLSMGGLSGIEVIKRVVAASPETKILIVSGQADERVINEALGCGASGYLSKSGSLREVPVALRQLHRGNSFVRMGRNVNTLQDGL